MTTTAPPHPTTLTVASVLTTIAAVEPLRVGVATTLPLPGSPREPARLFVLHFGQPALARKELLYAPHLRTILDGRTGAVVQHGPCTPQDLSVDVPPRRRFTSFGLTDVTDEAFWRARAEAERLAPTIWADYFDGALGDAPRARRATFLRDLQSSVYAPLWPFLRGASPSFFAWLERA